MPTYNLPQETGYNFSVGLDQTLVYISNEVTSYIPLILTSIFFLIFISGYYIQKRTEGFGSVTTWFAVSSWITFVVALLMTLVDGLINAPTVLITLALAFIGVILLIFGRE